VGDSSSRFSVNLNGLLGDGTYSQVMTAVQKGLVRDGATDWELLQLYQAGRLGGVNFYRAASLVDNPFG
jgi:hypothetical protein